MSDKTYLITYAAWAGFSLVSPVFLLNNDLWILNISVIIISIAASSNAFVRASERGLGWLNLCSVPRTGTIWHKVGDIL